MALTEDQLVQGIPQVGPVQNGLPPVLPSLSKPKPKPEGLYSGPGYPGMGAEPAPAPAAPAMPFTGLPPVTTLNPSPEQQAVGRARNNLESLQAKPSFTQNLWNKTKGSDSFIGKLGHVGAGLLRGVEVGGEILAPRLASEIPGTTLNRSAQIEKAKKDLTGAEANAKTAAETTKDEAETHKALYGDPLEAQKEQARSSLEDKKEKERETAAAEREAAAQRHQDAQFREAEERQAAGFKESEARQSEQFKHMDESQQRQFAQQNALEDKRLAAQKTNATRQDVRAHDKEFVVPAEGKEQTYKIFEGAYRDYLKAKIAGKHLPTGAQSMVALSAHLGTTFGGVKGNRVTRDLIEKHLGARGITDKAVVAFQRFTNGDELSPDQWKAFFDLVKSSRDESWSIAKKEAERKNIPVDFLPEDLNAPGTQK